MTLPMMPHAMRIMPPCSCPHCGSTAGVVRDERGYAYCQDCDKPRDGVAEMVARERAVYGGGPKEAHDA